MYTLCTTLAYRGNMRIAVVGSGIAGLGAAWLLRTRHEVTLYERNDYAGGHSNTLEVPTRNGTTPVDTGFMVFNHRNYPLLTGLFRHLNIGTQKTDMSFGVSIGDGRLEYAGSNLTTLMAQPRNWVSPTHYRMIADILRFNRAAKTLLVRGDLHGLDSGGVSRTRRLQQRLPRSLSVTHGRGHLVLSATNHGLIPRIESVSILLQSRPT